VTDHILPLFHNDATATLAWIPYLRHARYDDKLLAAGLLEGLVAEWDRLEELGQHSAQNLFFRLVASVDSVAGIAQEARQALLDQSVLAADGKYAAAFPETVVQLLRGDDIDSAEVWDRWLRDHIVSRLQGVPRNASAEELARWADAVPHLGNAITEALDMLSGRGVGLGKRFFDPDFSEGVLDGSDLRSFSTTPNASRTRRRVATSYPTRCKSLLRRFEPPSAMRSSHSRLRQPRGGSSPAVPSDEFRLQ
jgi:hypothetical protein